ATDTGDGVLAFGDFAQADQDLLEELRDVPVERVLVLDGLVVKSVKIAQQELSIVESSQDHAAAFRAQVASNVVGRHNKIPGAVAPPAAGRRHAQRSCAG